MQVPSSVRKRWDDEQAGEATAKRRWEEEDGWNDAGRRWRRRRRRGRELEQVRQVRVVGGSRGNMAHGLGM